VKAFQAHAKGATVVAMTARAAARKFFERFPNRRKCSVIEGTVDGPFFSVRYGRVNNVGEWPQSWRDVTKAQVETLPDVAIALTGKGEPIAGIEETRETT
jgi:hypothetical protein